MPSLTEPNSDPEGERLPDKPRRRRGRLVLGLLLLAALVVAGALAIGPALGARARLEEARASLEGARGALVAGDMTTATQSFAQAEEQFVEAREHLGHPLIRFASYLPLVGRTVDTVDAVAEAGLLVSRAAVSTTASLEGLPGGIGGLAPVAGALPVDALGEIAPSLEQASVLARRASELLERSPSSLLLPAVAAARAEFVTELNDALRVIRAGAALSRELPEFLGAEGPRSYFFGAQNPAELRGTGGLLGAFSILTVDNGKLTFGPFTPIQTLEDRGESVVEPPNPDFNERYRRFGGTGFWLNINMTADFPSAATAIERLYEEVQGVRLDGTIVADPFALQTLTGATGPVAVEGTDVVLDATNTVQVLSHDAYGEFLDSATRKLVLGESAKLIFDRFLNEAAAADPVGAARTLIQIAADGHLLMHSVAPEIQTAFETAGIAGKLLNPEGDFLGLFASNAAANKTDFYLEPSINYRVRLAPDGFALGVAEVQLTNQAPASGESSYIIGPFDDRFDPGENRSYLSAYCAAACRLESFEAPGELTEVIGSQTELGHPVYSTFVRIESGDTATLRFNWTVEDAWRSSGGEGRYTLTFQGQNTIRPTILGVDVEIPAGMSILSAPPGFQVEGTHARWEGPAGDVMRFDLAFERPRQTSPAFGVALVAGLVLLVAVSVLLLRWRAKRRT